MNNARVGLTVSIIATVVLILCPLGRSGAAEPMSTEFSYQGSLSQGFNRIKGMADFQCTLWDEASGGEQIGLLVSVINVPVADGVFNIALDFGVNPFTDVVFGDEKRWLEIAVRHPAGSGAYTTLEPRQMLGGVPYANQTRGITTSNDGKVGIGLFNPQHQLDISGSDSIVARLSTLAHADGSRLLLRNSNFLNLASLNLGSVEFLDLLGTTHGGMLYRRSIAGDRLVFIAGGQERMYIDQDGRVGIGTFLPQAGLHVKGASSPASFLFLEGDLGTDAGIHLINNGMTNWQLVTQASNNALRINNSGASHTVFYAEQSSGEVGIGTTTPRTQLTVADDRLFVSAPGEPRVARPHDHTALIEHTFTGDLSPDIALASVLALQVHHSDATPSSLTNFISFYGKNDNELGAVIGNGFGGVEYTSRGGDFAECLPHLNKGESFEPGDIVGVIGGRITRDTSRASQVMVVSTAPIVTGNHPDNPSDLSQSEKVAFVGQVPVRVRGVVREGDYVVASGEGGGVGIAVSADRLTIDQLSKVVGRAWESSNETNVKKINCMIGGGATSAAIERMTTILKTQERQIASLQQRLAQMETAIAQLDQSGKQLLATAE